MNISIISHGMSLGRLRMGRSTPKERRRHREVVDEPVQPVAPKYEDYALLQLQRLAGNRAASAATDERPRVLRLRDESEHRS